MTHRSTFHEQIRAMGMSKEETCAAIQDFERAELIAEVLLTAAGSFRRAAAWAGGILRWFVSNLSHRVRRKGYNSRWE